MATDPRTYTRAEVIDWMWTALRPFAFDYSPSPGFAREREAYHREQFADMLDRTGRFAVPPQDDSQ